MSKVYRCECDNCGAVQASYREPDYNVLELIDATALCCWRPDYYYTGEKVWIL